MTLTFDLLTLKVVSESHVKWATSVPILVFLCLSVLDLGPMYATDRRQTLDAHHRLMPPPIRGGSIIMPLNFSRQQYFSGSVMASSITTSVNRDVSAVVVDHNGGHMEHTFH